jgi:uncharacterized protein (TIGR02246 family)
MTDTDDIRALIDRFAAAIRGKDLRGVMSVFADDVISFDLGPPLQHGGGDVFVAHWRALFDAYDGAIEYEIRDLHVEVAHDLAFSRSLNRTAGTLKNGRRAERWLRWTACYRKRDSGWVIVHEHVSVPADLQRGVARLDLKP